MLVDMRKNDQYTWPQVREAWYQMTGKRTGNSTLPNRLEYVYLHGTNAMSSRTQS